MSQSNLSENPDSESKTSDHLKTSLSSSYNEDDNNQMTAEEYLRLIEESADEEEGSEKPRFLSVFEILDTPRILPEPVDLTLEHLSQIAHELGLIKLCWPKLKPTDFYRLPYSPSYLENTNKEKVLLLHTENFRRQFMHRFPKRKPLVLACDNECGVQKMVCTTIRPTTLPYAELITWEAVAKFAADSIAYEPMEEPTLIPKHISSPYTVFSFQKGHCFEISTAIVSVLIGLNYDAYVVSGYAIQDFTMNVLVRTTCPYDESSDTVEVTEEKKAVNKYQVFPPKELNSKFEMMMQQRIADKIKKEEEIKRLKEQKKREKEERIPKDILHGERIHSWVLVKANGKDVHEDFFLEGSIGIKTDINGGNVYLGVESVWNHENYWVNMQTCNIKEMRYDFTKVEDWEHFLIAEPERTRVKNKTDRKIEDEEGGPKNEAFEEQHLDMPTSWGKAIHIPHDALMRRYPDGSKRTFYKRTLVEEYAPFLQYDGLIRRITRYVNFDHTDLSSVEEFYENRKDRFYRYYNDVKENKVTEYFHRGRDDSVIKHVYRPGHDRVQDERIIEFNSKGRYDGLKKLEIKNNLMCEEYEGREDFLYRREVFYGLTGSTGGSVETRVVVKVVQKHDRNPDTPAGDDIALKIFDLQKRTIYLKYHYDKGKITASFREFVKPPLAEMGDNMKFNPNLTSGYQADSRDKGPRQLLLFKLLEEQIAVEEKALYNIREVETQLSDFLISRDHEMAFPVLDISIYNREHNDEFKKGMLAREREEKIHKEREVEEEIDYLSPYLLDLKDSILTREQAEQVKRKCLEEFKNLLIDRANNIQRQFETASEYFYSRQQWYIAHHDFLKPEEESDYFEEANNMMSLLRSMEIRLARHRDLSPFRFQALINYLNNHPKFKEVIEFPDTIYK